MKLVSYQKDEQDQLALLVDGLLYDTDLLHPDLPVSMGMFLNYWEDVYALTSAINKKIEEGKMSKNLGSNYDDAMILAPVPHATSFRNVEAFGSDTIFKDVDGEQEFENKFHQYPHFTFANHNCLQGPGNVACMPEYLNNLDFEMKIAVVICKAGKNISADDADEYIGGYMILNTISSRHFIPTETQQILSSKGKDFATPVGPVLVTPDELEPYKAQASPAHKGNTYNLSMKCLVNDELVSSVNVADMEWTFAEIIEQASYGVQLFPGDVIGSGPVNAGSFLAINKSGKLKDENYKEQWLKEGDVIEIQVEGLGKLTNTIVKDEGENAEPGDEEIQ